MNEEIDQELMKRAKKMAFERIAQAMSNGILVTPSPMNYYRKLKAGMTEEEILRGSKRINEEGRRPDGIKPPKPSSDNAPPSSEPDSSI